ncbi:MAG TPA: response regulator, partial [Candidatus Limnocylindrales bacterium]|nr:response regulator [Candidatus Limnocylindrales bacterium]
LYIRRLGYEVFEAATGLEALDQAHSVHPDLILMDLALPKMPGYEATALLKADPSTRDIPVIVNTAFHKGPFVESAITAGAAEILHKPVSLKALEEVVRRYLSPLLMPSETDRRVSVS